VERNCYYHGHVNAALFQEGKHKILTIMDINSGSIYYEQLDMLADEVVIGSSSQQVTPD